MSGVKTYLLILGILTFVGVHQCGRLGGGSEERYSESTHELLPTRAARAISSRRISTKRHDVTTPKAPKSTRRWYPITTFKRTTARTTQPWISVTTRRSSTTRRQTTTTKTTPSWDKVTQTRRTTTRTTQPWVSVTTRRSSTTGRHTTTTKTTPSWDKVTQTRRTTTRTTQPWVPVTTRRSTTTPRPTPPRTTVTTTRRTTIRSTQPWVSVPTRRTTTTRKPTTTTKRTTTRRKTTRTTTTPKLHSSTISWNNLPHRPGSGDKPTKVKIVNKYNYNYPGYYPIPVQNINHPGYYQTISSYRYSPSDTGNSVLGIYLGYKLASMTTPTYTHQSFYDGYRPHYDHYTVHHYYHNKEYIAPQQTVHSNTVVGCVGDSGSICPVNTTSLCTSDGKLMCVVSTKATVACTNGTEGNCVKSVVPCANNTAANCDRANTTLVSIPCISTAKIYGNFGVVNNTVVHSEVSSNATETTVMAANETTTMIPETSSVHWIWKRSTEIPQEFCVTVVAVPAKKIQTEGEKFLVDAKFWFSTFFKHIWND